MIWLFDVDGTLTPSREKMNTSFRNFFLNWAKNKKVYLVTGSNYEKTLEQTDESVLNTVEKVYSAMGNSIWKKGVNISNSDWKASKELIAFLENELKSSLYHTRTSNHIEARTGAINFSIIGRNCTKEQRKDYYSWDLEHQERTKIAKAIEKKFPQLCAQIGGEISIDITPRGKDKSQILSDFDLTEQFIFFGDRVFTGGNDFTLAQSILNLKNGSIVVHTTNWKDTHNKLLHMSFM